MQGMVTSSAGLDRPTTNPRPSWVPYCRAHPLEEDCRSSPVGPGGQAERRSHDVMLLLQLPDHVCTGVLCTVGFRSRLPFPVPLAGGVLFNEAQCGGAAQGPGRLWCAVWEKQA